MNLLANIVLLQAENTEQYWLAFDWLILIGIVLISVLMACAVYRFWLSGWVRNLRHPFHLRLFTVIFGSGLFLTGGGSFAFEYKWQKWDTQTFIWILIVAMFFWSALLLLEYFHGRKVRY